MSCKLTIDQMNVLELQADAAHKMLIATGDLNNKFAKQVIENSVEIINIARVTLANSEYISTHSTECHLWGPRHYHCLLSEFNSLAEDHNTLRRALAPAQVPIEHRNIVSNEISRLMLSESERDRKLAEAMKTLLDWFEKNKKYYYGKTEKIYSPRRKIGEHSKLVDGEDEQ
jgi:hypothetical protein